MNYMSQQPSGYGAQSYQSSNQGQQYKPSGFVQSHYQGQLSQPTFGRSQGQVGMSSFQAGNMNNQSANYGAMGQQQHAASYQSHAPVPSYASSPATAFGNVGPVIAHTGYQAGGQQQAQQPQQSQSLYQPQYQSMQHQAASHAQGMQAQGMQAQGSQGMQAGSQAASQYGMSFTQSQTGQNPVYQATNAYQQAGPVISKLGWQAGQQTQHGTNMH
ncbi:hypothetical protein [Paenibacillus chungangensis]|uniref:Uncharacterized protein n=1 Tax=Paenibacillus chungangensis TaxID=696535 RepID=A0ABW3HP94_9BACL